MTIRCQFLTAMLMTLCALAQAQSLEQRIKQMTDSFYRACPAAKGIIVHVESPADRLSFSTAAGVSDTVSMKPLRPFQPVLIASSTKTYVAAAILKLQELGWLDIERPVRYTLPADTRTLMQLAGYDLDAIRIKHLLSHSSGIDDYVDAAYFDTVARDRRRRWTREEQIRLAMLKHRPIGMPGDTFRYADINYLLLTQIIEEQYGMPFPLAIRELLEYDRNGLAATWFAVLEPAPAKRLPQPHQYWATRNWDSYTFDPSWDLYGGGGIIASAKDMGRFYQALFSGRIIRDTGVLNLMHRPVVPAEQHQYALGIRVLQIDGFPAYYHGGFWGTDAAYFPDLNASVAIVVLERDQRALAGSLCRMITAALRSDH